MAFINVQSVAGLGLLIPGLFFGGAADRVENAENGN